MSLRGSLGAALRLNRSELAPIKRESNNADTVSSLQASVALVQGNNLGQSTCRDYPDSEKHLAKPIFQPVLKASFGDGPLHYAVLVLLPASEWKRALKEACRILFLSSLIHCMFYNPSLVGVPGSRTGSQSTVPPLAASRDSLANQRKGEPLRIRILPKQIQPPAVIAVRCVADSNVVVNDSVKASGKGFHQASRDEHRPRHRRLIIASHDGELAATNVEGGGA